VSKLQGVDVVREEAADAPPKRGVDPLPRELVRELRAIVGETGLVADPGALVVWESDGLTAYRVTPRGVVMPEDTAQTAAVLRILAREGIPFVPRCSGTGL
jgi:glycolate oxidase